MKENFKLLRLRLYQNNVFDDIDVRFYDVADHPREPYTTLIIGPNGTGKSNLLRTLILLFQELKEFKEKGKRQPKIQGKFCLEYLHNSNYYKYFNFDFDNTEVPKTERKEARPQIWCNERHIAKDGIEIPSTIIALSIMLTDKFPPGITGFDNYVYLGVKTSSNTARTTSFIRKTIDLLYNALEDEFVYKNIAEGLKFLDYQNHLFVSYTPRYKHIIFQDDLNEEKLERFFTHFWEYTKRDKNSPPWSLSTFKRIKEESPSKIQKLVRLCKKIKKNFQYEYEGSKSQYFEFDIFESPFNTEETHLIRDLHALDLISYPTLVFQKKGKYFDIADSSSGEYHFISGFIGLLAKISQNSLVLIDEPENSLHPNWQMKYVSFLKKIFKSFSSSHIVIASHSHFMVSDLANSSSSIVGMRKGRRIYAEPIPSNTYGWSAEEILLSVFQTASTRNYYLSEQLNKIFELISEEPDKQNSELIRAEVNNLRKLDLSGLTKEDPLKDVVTKLIESF